MQRLRTNLPKRGLNYHLIDYQDGFDHIMDMAQVRQDLRRERAEYRIQKHIAEKKFNRAEISGDIMDMAYQDIVRQYMNKHIREVGHEIMQYNIAIMEDQIILDAVRDNQIPAPTMPDEPTGPTN
jgi:hypothetical protein